MSATFGKCDVRDHRETLRKIALLTFPKYKGTKISIDVADHVNRHGDVGCYIDWLVDLAHIEDVGPNLDSGDGAPYMLPLSSGVPILPNQSAQITIRAQTTEFRCERVVISNVGTPGGAADWIINDLRIGNRSQFLQSGDLPGGLFATNAIDAFVSFETVRDGREVVVIVTYVGPVESGVPFFAALVTNVGRKALPQYVRVHQPPRGASSTVTKIPWGFAYVSQRVNGLDGEDISVMIYVPSIDPTTIDVAVDATLTEGKPTQAVDTMISHALDDRGGLLHAAYVALVVQHAEALSAGEAHASSAEGR